MKVKFKKLSDKAVTPFKGTQGSAGFDITATGREIDGVNKLIEYSTDIAIAIPEGYVGLIFPRSSVYRTQLSLSNSVGVIDSDYRGEIKFKFNYNIMHVHPYEVGDRVGQLVIVPIPDVELVESDLDDTDRGEGGFGSTGK